MYEEKEKERVHLVVIDMMNESLIYLMGIQREKSR